MQLRSKNTVLILFSLIIILTLSLGSSSLPCNFDEIQPKDLGKKTNIKYVNPKNGDRTKRAVEPAEEIYEPIRISVFIHDLDDYVDTTEVERLTKVSRSAVSVIKKLLSGKFLNSEHS